MILETALEGAPAVVVLDSVCHETASERQRKSGGSMCTPWVVGQQSATGCNTSADAETAGSCQLLPISKARQPGDGENLSHHVYASVQAMYNQHTGPPHSAGNRKIHIDECNEVLLLQGVCLEAVLTSPLPRCP